MVNHIKKNTKAFEFGDTSIKFERPLENVGDIQQTSLEQPTNSNVTRNRSKKYDRENRSKTPEDRYAE